MKKLLIGCLVLAVVLAVTAGVGAALKFGRHVALTAGYERFSGINTGLWLVGWQLAY